MASIYITKNNLRSIRAAQKSAQENFDLNSANILQNVINKIEKEIERDGENQSSYKIDITKSEVNTLILGQKYIDKSKRAHSTHALHILILQAEKSVKGEEDQEKTYPFRIDIIEKEHQALVFAALLLRKNFADQEADQIENLLKKIEIKKLNSVEKTKIFGDEKPSFEKIKLPFPKIIPETNIHVLPFEKNDKTPEKSPTREGFCIGDRIEIIELPAKKTDYEIGDKGKIVNLSGKSMALVRWDKDNTLRSIKRKRIVKIKD